MASPAQEQPIRPSDDHLDFLLRAGQTEIDEQNDGFNHLDTKTGVILGFLLLSVSQVLSTLFKVSTGEFQLINKHPLLFCDAFLLSLLCIVLGTVFGLLELWPRDFSSGINFKDLRKAPLSDAGACKQAALEDIEKSLEVNRKANNTKVLFCQATGIMAAAALVLFVVSAFVMFWWGTPQTILRNH